MQRRLCWQLMNEWLVLWFCYVYTKTIIQRNVLSFRNNLSANLHGYIKAFFPYSTVHLCPFVSFSLVDLTSLSDTSGKGTRFLIFKLAFEVSSFYSVGLARRHICKLRMYFNPYPTAFPYGNGMVLHFYQQQESSTTKTVHKVINKGLKAYV